MLPKYVLVTPARDEARFIRLTLESMVRQRAKPVRWVIVSDGSTDGTDEIVNEYAAEHRWIELLRMSERRDRHFAGKVHSFNAGYARMRELDYEVVGSLDADISFDNDYFSFLLGKLAADPTLGVVGTPFKEGSRPTYDYRFVSIEHVSGACQVFRRQCFEDIGGYVPLRGGGVDYVAVVSARMKGWQTKTFTEKVSLHHRGIGTAEHGHWRAKFRNGSKDYALGYHPFWELCRAAHQIKKEPFIVGGVLLASGYFWALLRRRERSVSRELIAFTRREQMLRLRRFLRQKDIPSIKAWQAPSSDA